MIRATFAARGICSSSRAFAASSSVRQCLRTTAEMALATCASRTISRNSMRCICWDILHQFLIYGCYLFGRVSAGFTPSVSEPVSQRPLRSSDFSIQQSHPLSSPCLPAKADNPRWIERFLDHSPSLKAGPLGMTNGDVRKTRLSASRETNSAKQKRRECWLALNPRRGSRGRRACCHPR